MSSIITADMLKNIKSGSTLTGAILMKDYKEATTKNGKPYLTGEVQSGGIISFKVWNNSNAYTPMTTQDFRGLPVYIDAYVDEYQGVIGLTLNSITALSDVGVDEFLPLVYDADAYLNALKAEFESKVSDKIKPIADSILFKNDEVLSRFKIEFAASSHHDNCKSGLLAHTYKVVKLLSNTLPMYIQLVNKDGALDQDFVDCLYFGAMLHDLGKIKEMKLGVYQPDSIVKHTYLGLEMLSPYKDRLVELYDTTWWYNLVSIFLQHHGEFGEPCRTLASKIVHEMDYFESKMTSLQQAIENTQGDTIRVDNSYLNIR